MTNAVAVPNGAAPVSIMEEVIAKGDLSKLSPDERATYYGETCKSMGLNPLTKPFEYITLNGRLTLYATRTATDQLRKINAVSLEIVSEETTADGLRVVRVRATDKTGRSDEELGAVNVKGLAADNLANAYMKALTKAKRRATLSICGLGWLDESELETIPVAKRIAGPEIVPAAEVVDAETGEITDGEPEEDTGNPFLLSIRDAANKEALETIAAEIRADKTISDGERAVLVTAYKERQASLGLRPGGSTGK